MSHSAACAQLPALTGRDRSREEAGHRQQAHRAIVVSAIGLALTGGVELLLAVLTGSVALLGDALHNLSDVSTSAVVFVGFLVSKRPASRSHPYGFERAEDLAGLGIALVIWASAVFAGYESYRKLVAGSGTSLVGAGIAGAAVGALGNQLVARYKRSVGRRIHSATLVADATHSRLDAVSSLGALIGLVLVAVGQRWGDPVAGFAVTLFIVRVGVEVTREIGDHLLDGVEPDILDAAENAAASIDGVLTAAAYGRWMGRSLVLEIEARVSADASMTDAQHISDDVVAAVSGTLPHARRVVCRVATRLEPG